VNVNALSGPPPITVAMDPIPDFFNAPSGRSGL